METDERDAVVFAARVAEQIIAKADDGTKLLAKHGLQIVEASHTPKSPQDAR